MCLIYIREKQSPSDDITSQHNHPFILLVASLYLSSPSIVVYKPFVDQYQLTFINLQKPLFTSKQSKWVTKTLFTWPSLLSRLSDMKVCLLPIFRIFDRRLVPGADFLSEMVENMKTVASSNTELTVEERNLLSVAYKNVIGARRASWRIVTSIEQKEDSKGNETQVKLIKEYRIKIEAELAKICEDILEVLDKHLIPSAQSGESKVFYHKMYESHLTTHVEAIRCVSQKSFC